MKLKLSLLMLMALIGIGESFGHYSITGTGSGSTSTRNFDAFIITQNGSQIKVISSQENIQSINVYHILGRRIFSKDTISEKEFTISKDALNQQALIVKVKLANRQTISKKIIY